MPILNLIAGWLGMLAGIISGAVIGLFFHREDWMGGYDSWRRRLTRLGHIAFFGLGFLNILFALSSHELLLAGAALRLASWALILGAITMPLCCFLSAWRKPLRHFFPVPVLSLTTGIVSTLIGAWLK